jgi:hypothetical protein
MASRQIQVTQSSAFARGYKKLHQRHKQDLNTQVLLKFIKMNFAGSTT